MNVSELYDLLGSKDGDAVVTLSVPISFMDCIRGMLPGNRFLHVDSVVLTPLWDVSSRTSSIDLSGEGAVWRDIEYLVD